ncbi:RNA demethylase ALKBH9B-like [Euphorbia lathyris]|uniref:RNA demethylase ALKBH9B-like n=1 Tax=Euphorbia lathyris TaxID=212925 RepID=UPI00331420E2
MMTGAIATTSPGNDYMGVLKSMDPREILEVLSDGFCLNCHSLLKTRIHDLLNGKVSKKSLANGSSKVVMQESQQSADVTHGSVSNNNLESESLDQGKTTSRSNGTPESDYATRVKKNVPSPNSSPTSVNSHSGGSEILLNDGLVKMSSVMDNGLSEEQKEQIRFSNVGRKKNFSCVERVNGKSTNVLEGLQLHTKVFNAQEQNKIVECVYNLQNVGRKGQLRERTYSEPKKWMRGKGRVTMQFGCCYNYAVDKNGNPPGIIRDEQVDPLPPLFKQMIKRMVRWHVLPPTCIPNSCIVNIYDEGDCIPPHIDHHDFLRPFCTVSFLTECNILFGSNLKIIGPGEFSGPASIPLPVGSVLVLNGNGADVAKHCLPGVPSRRISITFRKMDDSKMPYKFSPDPELMGIKPLGYLLSNKSPYQQPQPRVLDYHSAAKSTRSKLSTEKEYESKASFIIGKEDFPPLGSLNLSSPSRANKSGSRQ